LILFFWKLSSFLFFLEVIFSFHVSHSCKSTFLCNFLFGKCFPRWFSLLINYFSLQIQYIISNMISDKKQIKTLFIFSLFLLIFYNGESYFILCFIVFRLSRRLSPGSRRLFPCSRDFLLVLVEFFHVLVTFSVFFSLDSCRISPDSRWLSPCSLDFLQVLDFSILSTSQGSWILKALDFSKFSNFSSFLQVLINFL